MKLSVWLGILWVLLATTGALAQQTTRLEGRVYLNDTVPAAYATVYLPQHNIGTVTDDRGHYLLDNIPVGPSVTLEYAYLGYRTEQFRANLSEPNHRYAHDQRLNEQAIQLDEVYLTPNGEEPSVYILRKVHEQGLANRKRLLSYTAVCEGSFHVQDLDVLVGVLPDFARSMLYGMLRPFGVSALFKHIASAPSVDATYRYTQTWSKGKVRNSDMTILTANPPMGGKEVKQLKKFQEDDFFSLFYHKEHKFDAKKARLWKLKGVIEENGLTIDVLTRTTTDTVPRVLTYYIIEDLWTVLRYESRTTKGDISRFECRDIGGGIYMPVLYVTNPLPLSLEPMIADLRKQYDEAQAKGESGSTERKMLERYERVLGNRTSVNINVVTPYSIRYSGVSVGR